LIKQTPGSSLAVFLLFIDKIRRPLYELRKESLPDMESMGNLIFSGSRTIEINFPILILPGGTLIVFIIFNESKRN
jgi:hypothetical protein